MVGVIVVGDMDGLYVGEIVVGEIDGLYVGEMDGLNVGW